MSLSFFLRGAALAAAFALGAGSVQAAEPVKLNEKQRTRGMTEAPALIQAAGVPCEAGDAYFIGESNTKGADGKTIKTQVVEVSCKAGGGYILNKNPSTNAVNNINCTQAFSQNAVDPKQIKCILPSNATHYTWLTPVVRKYDPSCTVNQARWLGQVTEQKFDRYEVGCEGRAGTLVDIPYGDSQTQLTFNNCLMAKASSACTFTTPEQAAQSLQAVATQAKAGCVVEKARWVGRVAEEKTDFYEIGCAGQPGFIVQTDTAMKYKATFGCDQAKSVGGCQYTDAAALTAQASGEYAQKLKAAGVNCTVGEFSVIGTETSTKRDLVEFKCPEQRWGLAAFVPAAGSIAKLETMDCFTLIARKKECSYVAKAQLDQQMDVLIKAAKKDCDVKQVDYLGRGDGDSILVEIACTNKRGYIGDVTKLRTGFNEVVACTIAKSRKYDLQCAIPGNGTYVPPAGGAND